MHFLKTPLRRRFMTFAVTMTIGSYAYYEHQKSKYLGTNKPIVPIKTFRLQNAYWFKMDFLQRLFGIPDVLSGPDVPLLAPPSIDEMTKYVDSLNLQTGQSYSAFSSSSNGQRSAHLYVHIAKVTTVAAIALSIGRSQDQVRRLLEQPYAFPLLWGGCMPYGGVTVDICPTPEIANDVIGSSRLVLTDGQDPILFSHHTSIPRSPSSGRNASATYFLARTLYGHALTGSVLHYMLVTERGDVVVMWLGAGAGVPVIGGHLNNLVALHDGHGIWPAMVNNLRAAFREPEVFNVFASALEKPRGDALATISAMNQLFRTRTQHRAKDYWLGELANLYGGALVRRASSKLGDGNTVKGQAEESFPKEKV
jgi:hypothetical protein